LCAGATPEQALSLSVACSAAIMDGKGITIDNVLRHDATLASVLDNQQ
jgi:hypothetical protein